MQALILAAGYGNRMRPLTDDTHKTLLMVGGKTIIGRIIDGLVSNGITDIAVVTGYRAEELSSYLVNEYPNLKFSFVNNERYKETNNIFSMALAFEKLSVNSDLILIESDLIYHPSVMERLLKNPHRTVALVDHFRSGMDGTVVAVSNGVVTSVIPPHLQGESFDFSDKFKTLNIYKFSKEFCETSFKKLLTYYANVIDDNCYYELMLGILIYMQKETIHAEVLEGEAWAEVDDPNDLSVAGFVFNENRKDILDKSFGGFWNYDVLDFCFIRNMYFPGSSIISEMRNVLPNLIHNYGSIQQILDMKMSRFLLCNPANVITLNGAAQIYPMIRMLYGRDKALMPNPTFGEYTKIFTSADFYSDSVGIDKEEIEAKSKDCDLVVFVNPNNPTGSFISTEWIYNFAKFNAGKTVIVDESFIEFTGQPSIITMLERVPLENVIVIKSLSKSLGIPGIRLGYTYSCNATFIATVRAEMPIWNANSLAEFMLEIILKHRGTLRQSITDTIRDREDFSSALRKLACVKEVYPSGANFILVKLHSGYSADAVSSAMLDRNSIYIKNISHKFAAGQYIRLAVRTPEDHAKFIAALSEVC